MLNYQRVVLKSSLGMIEQWVENLGQKHDWAGTEHIHPETAKQIAWLQIPPKTQECIDCWSDEVELLLIKSPHLQKSPLKIRRSPRVSPASRLFHLDLSGDEARWTAGCPALGWRTPSSPPRSCRSRSGPHWECHWGCKINGNKKGS